jgi:hypothetical protein
MTMTIKLKGDQVTRYIDTFSVGSIAKGLWLGHGWDWDAAYCAAYAFRHGKSSTRSPAQALADIRRSQPAPLFKSEVDAIEQAYRVEAVLGDSGQNAAGG